MQTVVTGWPVTESQSKDTRDVGGGLNLVGVLERGDRCNGGIAEAKSVSSIATSHGVSRETVRTQLKSALSKVGVNRQSELVRIVSGLSLPRDDA